MGRKKVLSLEKVQELNPELSRDEILAREGLTSPALSIDISCHKKTPYEKRKLKQMKGYHKQFGQDLNTQNAKYAFYKVAGNVRHTGKKNLKITVTK